MKQPLTARVQRARDIRLIVCMAAVSVLSFCVMLSAQTDPAFSVVRGGFIALYAVGCPISILDLYFTYSFCRWHNRWHRTLHEKGGAQGEPSAFALITNKIAGWFLFILMQIVAYIPAIMSSLFLF